MELSESFVLSQLNLDAIEDSTEPVVETLVAGSSGALPRRAEYSLDGAGNHVPLYPQRA
jgi:hypothetical protein